jgi:hypothetical protein
MGFLFLLATFTYFGLLIQSRDYIGEIKSKRLNVRQQERLFLDLDGDSRNETLFVSPIQVGWFLIIKGHNTLVEEPLIDFDQADSIDVEVARAFLLNEKKPVLLVAVGVSGGEADRFAVYDVVHTVRRLNLDVLLNEDAFWLNSSAVVKPGYIEFRHFRNFPLVKYLWDGEKFIKVECD